MARHVMSRLVFRSLTIGSLVAAFSCFALSLTHIVNEQETFSGAAMLIVLFAIGLPLLGWWATKSKLGLAAYTIMLNAVMAWFFLYYIDYDTPYIMVWIVPLLVSFTYFGWRAFIASAALLLAETELLFYLNRDILAAEGRLVYMPILGTIAALAVIGVAIVFIVMIGNARRDARKISSARHEQQTQLNRLNTLLNSLSDAVLTLNQYGRITSQNSAALSLLDTNESLIGKGIDMIVPLKDSAMNAVSIRELAKQNTKRTLVRDDVALHSGDETTRISLQISPIHGIFQGFEHVEDEGSVVILRDITRQKTLEDEKDEFISVTSHELRTPIAIAEGSLSNLGLMFDKKMPEDKLRASVTTAHDQILYLARIINDLSTLSRAERGVGDTVEEIDVNQMLQDLYLRYQPEAAAKSLTLDIDLDQLPHVNTSRLYLEEILQNFITNAIKYTHEGGVTIAGKMINGRITCSVTDTGIGISKSDQEKVFNKFFRSEDYRTRETSGTGLGLYVVSKLANKLGTHVEVSSRLNHGSTFSFALPLVSPNLGTGTRSSERTK